MAPQSNLAIRPAAVSESPVITGIRNSAFDDTWSVESVTRLMMLPGALANIAVLARMPCGASLLTPSGPIAELALIAVDNATRHKGIGRALLDDAVVRAAHTGYEAVCLEVAADNRAAIHLYTAADFIETGRRKNYYRRHGRRVDALLMRRAL